MVAGMRVALYARISTNDGRQDLETQLRDLRAYVAAREGWVIVETYTDETSGAKRHRPGLDALMSAAHLQSFDVVLVWKFDRFARSLNHLVEALAQFEKLGVNFAAARDQVDTTTPTGRLMFHMIGAMAEFERSLISERVKAGLARARAEGKKFGGRKAEVDMEKIRELRSQGWGYGRIAKAMKIPKATVQSAVGRL